MTPEQAALIIELISIEALISARPDGQQCPKHWYERRDELQTELRESAMKGQA